MAVKEAFGVSSRGKISNESPVGAAILGHTIGDTVEVSTPGGVRHMQILTVHHND